MLQTTLCNIKLKNPTVLASGILGITKPSIERIAKGGAGAATLKSLCHEQRTGHPNPTMFATQEGFLNAVGLPGQGIDSAIEDFKRLDDCSIPVIASVFGYSIEQFAQTTKKMATLKPAMIEINISCPNIKGYHKPFFADEESIAKITKQCKKAAGSIPISIKLAPNVHNIKALAQAAEYHGADALTVINTMPGMHINIDARQPVLANKAGGLSGQALKPIAIKCVYDVYEAVKIPIIGTGGIETGEDAIEMIMAGATAVAVGTALYKDGPNTFKKICDQMKAWMKVNNVKSLDDIRGCAHE